MCMDVDGAYEEIDDWIYLWLNIKIKQLTGLYVAQSCTPFDPHLASSPPLYKYLLNPPNLVQIKTQSSNLVRNLPRIHTYLLNVLTTATYPPTYLTYLHTCTETTYLLI
jgi:hypothetical protein